MIRLYKLYNFINANSPTLVDIIAKILILL